MGKWYSEYNVHYFQVCDFGVLPAFLYVWQSFIVLLRTPATYCAILFRVEVIMQTVNT